VSRNDLITYKKIVLVIFLRAMVAKLQKYKRALTPPPPRGQLGDTLQFVLIAVVKGNQRQFSKFNLVQNSLRYSTAKFGNNMDESGFGPSPGGG